MRALAVPLAQRQPHISYVMVRCTGRPGSMGGGAVVHLMRTPMGIWLCLSCYWFRILMGSGSVRSTSPHHLAWPQPRGSGCGETSLKCRPNGTRPSATAVETAQAELHFSVPLALGHAANSKFDLQVQVCLCAGPSCRNVRSVLAVGFALNSPYEVLV